MTPQRFIEQALAGDVLEAYDLLDELLQSMRKHAPRHASQIEKARDLVFSVRVEMETEESET